MVTPSARHAIRIEHDLVLLDEATDMATSRRWGHGSSIVLQEPVLQRTKCEMSYFPL